MAGDVLAYVLTHRQAGLKFPMGSMKWKSQREYCPDLYSPKTKNIQFWGIESYPCGDAGSREERKQSPQIAAADCRAGPGSDASDRIYDPIHFRTVAILPRF